VSLFERILPAVLALLLVAALVGLLRHDIDRTAAMGGPLSLSEGEPGRIRERCSLLTGGMGYLEILIVGLVALAIIGVAWLHFGR
jgi:hypothetical protein